MTERKPTQQLIDEMDPPFHEFVGDAVRCAFQNCGARRDRAVHSLETATNVGAPYVRKENPC